MRKLVVVVFAVTLAGATAMPAGASHQTGQGDPHNCLGEFHSTAARSPAFHPLGQFVSRDLVPAFSPFGREFVKDRASECEGV